MFVMFWNENDNRDFFDVSIYYFESYDWPNSDWNRFNVNRDVDNRQLNIASNRKLWLYWNDVPFEQI